MALVIVPHRPPLSSAPASLLWKSARPRVFIKYPRRLRPSVATRSFYRSASITSKCSFTNVDIDLDHVATEENISEDLPPIASSCSIPVIHLKADILDSNIPSLLVEDASEDYLSEELPISSEDGEEAITATPTHPAGLYAMYASFVLGNLVEQLWNITWPAAVATLHSSLLPVAVVGFFTKLTIFIAGPMVGKLMDHFPRVPAYHSLNFVQTAAQLLSACTIIHALNTVKCNSASYLLLQPWFILLVVASAIERLAGLALGVAMERDWVVLLAGKSRPIALAQANSMLSRIDLSCEIAGASLFGIMLSKYDLVTCLKLACSLMTCMLPVLVILGELINRFSDGILGCSKTYDISSENFVPLSGARQIVKNGLNAIEHGWNEYKHQPVLPASLAYVLLYFNVALAPGSIMTALLTHRGIHPSIIGGFSGLCSVMGFAATFITASLVKQFGLLKAGASGLIFQAFLLSAAVVVYWTSSITHQTSLFIFLSLIVLSRLGHMSYDVVGTQILQTGIPITKANLIGTTEVSVASLAEFLMLGVAIIANDVSHFGFLAILSLSSVVGAAAMFCRWLENPSDEHRKLFKFDLHYN